MATQRLAILGLGQATRNIHLPALAGLPDRFRIVAGMDPDPYARGLFAERFPDARAVETVQEALACSPRIVLIASPPHLHAEQAIAALDGGCHVFCEKPMATSLDEADAMTKAASEAGRALVINSEFPDMLIFRAAKREIGSRRFGRLLFASVAQDFRRDERTEAGWRGETRRRVCLDFGIHLFELVRYFFGESPARIDCRMPDPCREGKEVMNLVHLEWADGRAAAFVINRLAQGPQRYLEMRLTGEYGEITCSIGGRASVEAGLTPAPIRPYARLHWARGGEAVLRRGRNERTLARESASPFVDATRARLQELEQAIRSAGNVERMGADHRETLKLALAAYESAESGRAVEVADFAESAG